MYQTPILFLIFNRPHCTQEVFARIREMRPKRLYIAADGPRKNVAADSANCSMARRVADQVDWPCELRTLFRDENLGCGRAISEAITWFFRHESQGVILEDDCFPSLGFFDYAQRALNYYEHDDRFFAISGCSLGYDAVDDNTAFCSRFMNMWGWATWRRSAQLVDYQMNTWRKSRTPLLKLSLALQLWPSRRNLCWLAELAKLFQQTAEGRIDTWDYQWIWAAISKNTRVIFPPYNLVRNLGFHHNATHTTDHDDQMGRLVLRPDGCEPEIRLVSKPELRAEFEHVYVRDRWFRFKAGLFRQRLKMAVKLSAEHLTRNGAYHRRYSSTLD